MPRRMLFAGAAALWLGAWAQEARADVHIGVAGPMTGSNATFGEQEREGARQAVADLNAAGGVLGQTVVLDVGDDACDPRQAVSVANDLASKGVKFVAGHYCSGSSIPASKVYADEGILEISPASTNPDYTDKGTWNTFRVCGRDDQQGAVAGKFLAERFKGEKIAILNDNSAYGKGLAAETEKGLVANGGKAELTASFTPGEKDYSALVSRLKGSGIAVIYVGGYQTESGLIIRQAKEQGMKATLVGGDALQSREFWQITGDAGNGTLMTFPPDPRNRPVAKKVVDEFSARKVDPEGYVLYTYASVQVWAEGAKKAGSLEPKKIAAALRGSGPFETVVGPISFDKKGDITESGYVLYIWKDGNYAQM